IFEVNYGAPEQTAGVVGSVQTLFTLPAGYPGGDAYGLIQVAPDLVALYSANDQRGNGATYFTSGYTDAQGRKVTWGVPNGAAFRVARRREVAFEGQRWFDLSRWGILDATIRAKTTNLQTWQPGEVKTVHGAPSALYPIPQPQLNNNPQLTQNQGW